jgi:hypothetical protein
MSVDPLFCDRSGGEFTLLDASPCAPENNDCGVLIGALPVACLNIPEILSVSLPGESDILHVVNHLPSVSWQFNDPASQPQSAYEIEVGTDDDWEYAEMWDPMLFESADTAVVYDGASLGDGETYWLRLRLRNNQHWSEWYETSLRMNSLPTVPLLSLPQHEELVLTPAPTLVVENSSDAEADSLFYELEVSPDSFVSEVYLFTAVEQNGGTTSLTPDSTLLEDTGYWWRARAGDYYENSQYSEAWTFYIDTENTAPSAFQLESPDTLDSPVQTLLPEFIWSPAIDPDPLDSIVYSLHHSEDSTFEDALLIVSTVDTSCTLADSLSWGSYCWWKVAAEDSRGGITWSSNTLHFWTVIPGDTDGDGEVNVADIVSLVSYVFAGGPAPEPEWAGDVDCNGSVNVSDVVYLINYVFGDGPEPCEP